MGRFIVPHGATVEPHHIAEWALSADYYLYEGGVDEDLLLSQREYIGPLMTAVLRPDCERRTEILEIMTEGFYREFLHTSDNLDPAIEEAIEIASNSEFQEVRDWAAWQRERLEQTRNGLVVPADLNAMKEQMGWKWLP